MPSAPTRTAVYHLYDISDALLYVGVAKNFGLRWSQHATAQPWWGSVHHQTVTWYESREDALLAEKVAINDERPVYNIRDSPWVALPKDDGTGFEITPKVRATAARPGERHKNPTLCWHPPAELSGWARDEAERRGGRGALSDLLTEALAAYRASMICSTDRAETDT